MWWYSKNNILCGDSNCIIIYLSWVEYGYLYAALNQGHREFPFWKHIIPPPKKKFLKIPIHKMLDFARSNIINIQSIDIYLNQLQWYGQFAELYKLCMLLEVLILEIYPNIYCIENTVYCKTCIFCEHQIFAIKCLHFSTVRPRLSTILCKFAQKNFPLGVTPWRVSPGAVPPLAPHLVTTLFTAKFNYILLSKI